MHELSVVTLRHSNCCRVLTKWLMANATRSHTNKWGGDTKWGREVCSPSGGIIQCAADGAAGGGPLSFARGRSFCGAPTAGTSLDCARDSASRKVPSGSPAASAAPCMRAAEHGSESGQNRSLVSDSRDRRRVAES